MIRNVWGVCLVIVLLLVGCERSFFQGDDLIVAKEALDKGEWVTAQHILERFLTTEDDPERRWEAWQLAVISSRHLNPDGRFAMEHLRDAYDEFQGDSSKAVVLLRGLAEGYSTLRMYRQAAEAFTALSRHPLDADEAMTVYARLATLELRLGNADAAEDACFAALKLPVSNDGKARILLTLSEILLIRRDAARAEEIVNAGLALTDIKVGTKARLQFVLADIFDLRGLHDNALRLFNGVLKDHPNPQVVACRIDALRTKTGRTLTKPEPSVQKTEEARKGSVALRTPSQAGKKALKKKVGKSVRKPSQVPSQTAKTADSGNQPVPQSVTENQASNAETTAPSPSANGR